MSQSTEGEPRYTPLAPQRNERSTSGRAVELTLSIRHHNGKEAMLANRE